MDNNWNINIKNGSKPRYNLDRRGFLEIKNVTEADQGSEYRCTLKTDHGRESTHIILAVVSEEGNFSFFYKKAISQLILPISLMLLTFSKQLWESIFFLFSEQRNSCFATKRHHSWTVDR